METGTYLSQKEIRELTGKVRSDAQLRELAAMGIVARTRRDGTPKVLRAHHDRVMGLKAESSDHAPEPDWGILDGTA